MRGGLRYESRRKMEGEEGLRRKTERKGKRIVSRVAKCKSISEKKRKAKRKLDVAMAAGLPHWEGARWPARRSAKLIFRLSKSWRSTFSNSALARLQQTCDSPSFVSASLAYTGKMVKLGMLSTTP